MHGLQGGPTLAARKLYFSNNYLYGSLQQCQQHSVNKHTLIFSDALVVVAYIGNGSVSVPLHSLCSWYVPPIYCKQDAAQSMHSLLMK